MLLDLRVQTGRDQTLPIMTPTQFCADAGKIEYCSDDLLAVTSILDIGLMNQAVVGNADPLGLNLFGGGVIMPSVNFDTSGRVASALEYRGSESDHVPPEKQALSYIPLSGNKITSIPDDYDPLTDILAAALPAATIFPIFEEGTVPLSDIASILTPASHQLQSRTEMPHLGEQIMIQALLKGLGLPHMEITCSGPELAEQVGSLLREANVDRMSPLLAFMYERQEVPIATALKSTVVIQPSLYVATTESMFYSNISSDRDSRKTSSISLTSTSNDLPSYKWC